MIESKLTAIVDDQGKRTLVDRDGLRFFTEESTGYWEIHLAGAGWSTWVDWARAVVDADERQLTRGE